MKVYTIKEAARETKIGMEVLKRACEEGLIPATKLANRQWRIAESALAEALHKGMNLQALPKKTGKKGKQPDGLKKAQEANRKAKTEAATTTNQVENSVTGKESKRKEKAATKKK